MARIGELFVRLRADTTNFQQGMNQAKSMSGTLKAVIAGNLSQIGSQMANTGKAIVGSIGGIVSTASEWSAQVQQQKFVYDNLDGSVQKAINNNQNMAGSLGMTKQQYMNNSTAVADFLSRMGMSSQSIAEQSGKVTQLTADMAAFADVPVDEATSDFKSALVGNFEALDKYGVNVSVATINSGEYAKSLGKSWDKMTQAEKAQAILSQTISQSSSITGLAKQESEGFTMKLAQMKQRLMETAAAIGEKLFPVLEPLIGKIIEITTNVTNWANEHPKLTQGILMVIGVIGTLMAVGGPLIMIFASLATISLAVGVGMLPLVGIIAGVTAVIVALVGIGVTLWQNWDMIKQKAAELGQAISQAWNSIVEWTIQTWNSIVTTISGVWNNIVNVVTVGVMLLGNIISGAFQIITIPFRLIWENCKGIVTSIWNAICSTISNFVLKIASTVKTKFNQVKSTITTIFNAVKSVTSSVWNAISSVIKTVAGAIFSAVSSKFNQVKSTVSSIWNGIKSTTSSIWNGIKSTVSSVVNGIRSNVSSVFNSVKSTVTSVWNGIKSAITGPINSARSAVSSAMSAIKNAINVHLKPNLKLPHISVSGKLSLNPPSVPKIGVNWYAKGGIMTSPTMFGLSGNTAHVGGEAGPEAILPLKGFYDHLDKKLDSNKSSNIDYNEMTKCFVKALQEIQFNVDGKNLFSVMSPYMGRASRGF